MLENWAENGYTPENLNYPAQGCASGGYRGLNQPSMAAVIGGEIGETAVDRAYHEAAAQDPIDANGDAIIDAEEQARNLGDIFFRELRGVTFTPACERLSPGGPCAPGMSTPPTDLEETPAVMVLGVCRDGQGLNPDWVRGVCYDN